MEFLLAQATGSGQGGQSGGWLQMLGGLWFLPVIILIFWFLVFRPERQKQKKRQAMIDSIGKNDKVVTIGGMHGIVKSINDTEVTLLVDEKLGTQIKFNRSAIFAKITGDEAKGELEPPQK